MNPLLFLSICVVWTVHCAGTTKPIGIAQFWMDDIKVLDQLYGKTSDKEIYGENIPSKFKYDVGFTKTLIPAASQHKERILNQEDEDIDSDELLSPYLYNERYAKQFAKIKNDKAKKTRLQFLGLQNFKQISQASDPETYSYLKNLEESDKHNSDYVGNIEAEDAYKSIQDILEAHEANKGRKKEKYTDDSDKYNRYREAKEDDDDDDGKYARYAAKVPNKKVKFQNSNRISSRCRFGRCRKRISGAHRISTRPYIRKIKHYSYS